MRLLFAAPFCLALAFSPASACDVVLPPDLIGQPLLAKQTKIREWRAFNLTPKAMVDGRLMYRHVKHVGMPSGAGEQKIFNEHVGPAAVAAYGGKATGVKIDKSAVAPLTFKGASTPAKSYSVTVNRAGGLAPIAAGVVIRANAERKDIAIVMIPIDPDSPGDDPDHTLKIVRAAAAHPGYDCTEKNMP